LLSNHGIFNCQKWQQSKKSRVKKIQSH